MDFNILTGEIKEFYRFLKYERQLSNLTVLKYITSISKLKAFLNRDPLFNKTLFAATREDISNYLACLRDNGLHRNTITNYIVSLRSFYSWAMYVNKNDNLIAVNFLLKTIIKTKIERGIPFMPTREEVEKLRVTLKTYKELLSFNKNAYAYRKTLFAYTIIELLITTGMRSKELRSLRKKDLDLENRAILIKFGKGGYQRMSLFGDSALPLLKEYLEINNFSPDDFVFPVRQGNVLHYMIKRWAKRAQINSRMHIHAFRHYFITESQRQGVPVEIVADQVGHKNLNTTRHYTHFTLDFIREKYKEKII